MIDCKTQRGIACRAAALGAMFCLLIGCSDDTTTPRPDGSVADTNTPIRDVTPGEQPTLPDAPAGGDLKTSADVTLQQSLSAQATVSVSFNSNLKAFINDGLTEGVKPNCDKYYYWLSKFPRKKDKFIELSWGNPVSVGRVTVDTVPRNQAPHANCNSSDQGRTLGFSLVKVQYDKGGGWVDLKTVSGKTDDWSVSFTPASINKLRLLIPGSVTLDTNPILFELGVFAK